jgi:hypothetical protein
VVSHAGVGLLREMAGYTGLAEGVTDALIGTCKGVPAHAPGRVFTDLAVAAADGADAISGIRVLTDREETCVTLVSRCPRRVLAGRAPPVSSGGAETRLGSRRSGVAANGAFGHCGERVRDAPGCQSTAGVEQVEGVEAREQPERVGGGLGIDTGP